MNRKQLISALKADMHAVTPVVPVITFEPWSNTMSAIKDLLEHDPFKLMQINATTIESLKDILDERYEEFLTDAVNHPERTNVLMFDDFWLATPEAYGAIITLVTTRPVEMPRNVRFVLTCADTDVRQFNGHILFKPYDVHALNSRNIDDVFHACLSKNNDDKNAMFVNSHNLAVATHVMNMRPEDRIVNEPATYGIMFNKTRLGENKQIIKDMILELPGEFMKSNNPDGCIFTHAVCNYDDYYWTKKTEDIERLFALGTAIGMVDVDPSPNSTSIDPPCYVIDDMKN